MRLYINIKILDSFTRKFTKKKKDSFTRNFHILIKSNCHREKNKKFIYKKKVIDLMVTMLQKKAHSTTKETSSRNKS